MGGCASASGKPHSRAAPAPLPTPHPFLPGRVLMHVYVGRMGRTARLCASPCGHQGLLSHTLTAPCVLFCVFCLPTIPPSPSYTRPDSSLPEPANKGTCPACHCTQAMLWMLCSGPPPPLPRIGSIASRVALPCPLCRVQMLGGVYLLAPVDDANMPLVLDNARANLNATVFFGISDHWNTTICLFHKELNGPGARPSEFVNARKNGDKQELGEAELVSGRL
jgi:hypothetical protein